MCELMHLCFFILKINRYEEQVREQQSQLEKEDFSDMVAEHAAKQKVCHLCNTYICDVIKQYKLQVLDIGPYSRKRAKFSPSSFQE